MSSEHPVPEERWPTATHGAWVRAFDYVAAASFGAVAATVAWAVVPASLPGLLEMGVGMAVGALVVVPLLGLFSWMLGGFEILVLAVQAGMFAGMVGVMTDGATPSDVAFEGVLVGLLVQLLLHGVDRSLGGEVPDDA